MTWLIATLGAPGSGKTHFSERLAKKLGFFHLNADRFRLELYKNPTYQPSENAHFFPAMDFVAEELLRRHISVIYDANSTRRAFRKKFQHLAAAHKAKFLLLFIETPSALALDRLAKRRTLRDRHKQKYFRPTKDEIHFRIRAEIERPSREPFVHIDGTKTFLHEWPKIARAMGIKQ